MARGEVARMFVAIGADVRGGIRGIENVRGDLGKLQRETKRSADAWTGFTGTLARTGLAVQGMREIFRVGRDVAGMIGGLAFAADDERVSMERLMGTIQNTGRAVDNDLRQKLDDALGSMERTTLFSDDELRQALSTIVIGTQDVDEALRRLPLAADYATVAEEQLGSAAKKLAKINDEALDGFAKIGIVLPKAAAKSGDYAAAQMLAAKAGLSLEGAMKGIQSESVRKRHGIPDPSTLGGGLDAQRLISEGMRRIGGSAELAASGTRGGWKQVGDEMERVREQLGEFMLPLAGGAVRFMSKSLSGVRRLLRLFFTDSTGPTMAKTRKLWKEIFGTEMPKALGATLDSLGAVRDRIAKFVEDIADEEDPQKLRAAVKAFARDIPAEIGKAFGSIGGELDKAGLAGQSLKLSLLALGALSVPGIGDLTKDFLGLGIQVGILLTNIARVHPALLAAIVVPVALYTLWDTLKYVADEWDTFIVALRGGYLNDIPLFGPLFQDLQQADRGIQTLVRTWNELTTLFSGKGAATHFPMLGAITDWITDQLPGLREIKGIYEFISGKKLEPPPPPGRAPGDYGGWTGPAAVTPQKSEWEKFQADIAEGGLANNVWNTNPEWRGWLGPEWAARAAIPMFHHGGDVPRDTLAWLQGGEHVLSRDQVSRGGGGQVVNITINGDVDSTERVGELERALGRRLRLYAGS